VSGVYHDGWAAPRECAEDSAGTIVRGNSKETLAEAAMLMRQRRGDEWVYDSMDAVLICLTHGKAQASPPCSINISFRHSTGWTFDWRTHAGASKAS
jgi:hypothetical protein